jgi:hypothetical protein
VPRRYRCTGYPAYRFATDGETSEIVEVFVTAGQAVKFLMPQPSRRQAGISETVPNVSRERESGYAMKNSWFEIDYAWPDTRSIRIVANIVSASQVLGGVVGLFIVSNPNWILRLWIGAAIVTFPAFLVGLTVQARAHPGILKEKMNEVIKLGLACLIFSVAAIFVPKLGFR